MGWGFFRSGLDCIFQKKYNILWSTPHTHFEGPETAKEWKPNYGRKWVDDARDIQIGPLALVKF